MIRIREIETKALQCLERVDRKEFREDSLVEIKRELPQDTFKVARRIAAHCNAMRGEVVLWIIGANESEGIVGWSSPDLAEYLPKIWSHFDDEPPDHEVVAVSYDGKVCTALALHASRAPYLVKNPHFGKEGHFAEKEIPWRDGTRTRSAKRDEVMRLLMEYSRSPEVEVFTGKISAQAEAKTLCEGEILVQLTLDFYVMPRSAEPIIIPLHRIRGELADFGHESVSNQFRSITFSSREKNKRWLREVMRATQSREQRQVVVRSEPDESIKDTGSELIISRPAHVECVAEVAYSKATYSEFDRFKAELVFPAGPDRTEFCVRWNDITKR